MSKKALQSSLKHNTTFSELNPWSKIHNLVCKKRKIDSKYPVFFLKCMPFYALCLCMSEKKNVQTAGVNCSDWVRSRICFSLKLNGSESIGVKSCLEFCMLMSLCECKRWPTLLSRRICVMQKPYQGQLSRQTMKHPWGFDSYQMASIASTLHYHCKKKKKNTHISPQLPLARSL